MRLFLFILSIFLTITIFADVRLLHNKVTTANKGENIAIEANVTEFEKVNYIIVNYKCNSEHHWSQIEMKPESGVFTAEIPSAEKCGGINYYIEVFDMSEKILTSFASQKDPQSIFIVKSNNDNYSVDVKNKNQNIKFKTKDKDFELYMSELASVYDVEVVTASKTAQKATDAPATIYVVTKDIIKRRGYQYLTDLLEDIPEVEIQRKSNAEWSNILSFRGLMGNAKFIILQDGVRINSPTGTPHAITKNFPLANAKRVEVILGPASALYGVDAFTGIVNIITEDGGDINGVVASGSYGMYNSSDNYLTGGVKAGDFQFSTTGHFYLSDEPNLADKYKDDFDEYDWYFNKYKANGTVVDFGSPTGESDLPEILPYDQSSSSYYIHAKASYKNFEVGFSRSFESHISSGGMRPEYYPYHDGNIYEMIIDSYYAKNSFIVPSKRWGMDTLLWYGSYNLTPETQFDNVFTSYQDGYKYAEGKIFRIENQININISNFSLIIGFSFDDINDLPKTGDLPKKYDPDMPADDQDLYYIGTDIGDGSLKVMQDFYDLHYNNFGFYGQFQGSLFDNKILPTVGGRFDYNTRYGKSINPRAGLVIHPIKTMTIKLLYGEAFLAPSPYEAYQHYGSFIPINDDGDVDFENPTGFMGAFWHLRNKDLKPEKLRTIEGGFQMFVNKNIFLSLNGFYTMVDDLVLYNSELNQEFKGYNIQVVQRPKNSGSATSYGGTLKADGTFKIGGIMLNPYASYSYIDGEINDVERSNGEKVTIPLTYSAKHTIKGGIDFQWKGLSLSTKVLYRSESYNQDLVVDPNNPTSDPVSNDSYFILHGYLLYTIPLPTDMFEISLYGKFTNILDAKYYNVAVGGVESFTKTPQDPFRAIGGLTIKYNLPKNSKKK